MVNEYTKSNTGKLLAAIVAMLMVVCAVAVVAMPAEAADETVDIDSLAEYDLDAATTANNDAKPVTASNGTDNVAISLADAITIINGGTVSSITSPTTLTFSEGKYDVTVKNTAGNSGSAFYVNADLTINAAADATVYIYADASNGQGSTVIHTDDNYVLQQEMIQIAAGKTVTIDGLTVMNMITPVLDDETQKTSYQPYKSITINGSATIKNVTLVANTFGAIDTETYGEYAYKTWGGSILSAGNGDIIIDGVEVQNGSINTGFATGGTVTVSNTTIVAEDDMCSGFRNTDSDGVLNENTTVIDSEIDRLCRCVE